MAETRREFKDLCRNGTTGSLCLSARTTYLIDSATDALGFGSEFLVSVITCVSETSGWRFFKKNFIITQRFSYEMHIIDVKVRRHQERDLEPLPPSLSKSNVVLIPEGQRAAGHF